MNIPELLAPVGSHEAFTAAVQNGADAVYLGGTMFSARQYADNFDRAALRTSVEYAHIRDVRVYVTMNTLISDSELPEAVDYLKFLYEAGVDAVIVQDLGLARTARELLPQLTLHASTQMTIHNSAGAAVLKNLGINRVVLARELSINEIREIKEKTGMQVEVFIHGALCISYSGQCLMSSMIGGRSGNRGRCAQPCRMEYTLVDEKGVPLADPEKVGRHLLSPRDLSTIEHIPVLAEAGIDSLKIEGRMKRPEYVAIVTRIYREALDRYRESPGNYAVPEKDLKDLAQIFNRGFSTGYLFGKSGSDMMSFKRPNNRGLLLGRVTRSDWAKGLVEIGLEDNLHRGDGVEFWVTEGGRRGSVVNLLLQNGHEVEEAPAGEKVWIQAEGKIRPGDRVFKTLDAEMVSRAEQSYKSPRELKKIPLQFSVKAIIGSPIEITVTDDYGRSFTAVGDVPAQEALHKPLTHDFLVRQIDRLGNTPFALGSLQADIGDRVMVPVSEINETRRKAIDGLVKQKMSTGRPKIQVAAGVTKWIADNQEQKQRSPENPKLTLRADGMSILKAAVKNGADMVYFGGTNIINKKKLMQELGEALAVCKGAGVQLAVSTPRIVREDEMQYVRPLLEFAESHALPVLAANLGVLAETVGRSIPAVYADYPLNIFNAQSVRWLVENRVTQAAVSPELTLKQIEAMSHLVEIQLEAVVEGHMPLMVTEYCPTGSLMGNMTADTACSGSCRPGRTVGLKDRLGLVFPTLRDEFCRNYIFNAKELSMIEDIRPLVKAGVSRLRIETTVEDSDRAAAVTRFWRREMDAYLADPENYRPEENTRGYISEMSPAGLTKGHYYRGVE